MNILIVNPFDLNSSGGVCTAVLNWYREFERQGHEVCAFQAGQSNAIVPVGERDGFHIYAAYLRSPYIEGSRLRSLLSFVFHFPMTLWRLHRFLARNKIEMVTIQYPLSWMLYFGVLRRLGSIKLVVTYQGNDAHDLMLWSPLERRCVRFLLSYADRIVGVSKPLLAKIRTVFPDLGAAYEVVPNGAPVESIEESSEEAQLTLPGKYIVSVGHLISRKGIDIAVKAMALLKHQGDDIELVLVGDGPEREAFEKLAVAEGVAERVHFAGNQTHGQTIAIIKRSLFFILASRAEGLPLVIAEAMGCKKAVVATSVDGIPEIVADNETGLLIPPESPQALADAVAALINDQAKRDQFAEAGFRLALEKFSWQAIARRHLQIYADIA